MTEYLEAAMLVIRASIAAFLVSLSPSLFAAESTSTEARIDAWIARMTPRERIAQLLCVGFSGIRVDEELRYLVSEVGVGAIALYAQNIQSPQQLRELTAGIRALGATRVPPFIAVDQEGGEVTRIFHASSNAPGNMALGATRSSELSYATGRAIGRDLRHFGITMNFAPVLDMATTPRSAINIRSFGSDPDLVSRLGSAFIRGQSEAGIASVPKHFPGIGDAEVDSHRGLPILDADAETRRRHMNVFRAALAHADGVMIGHVLQPSLDRVNPATLSPAVMSVLRRDLRYDGLLVTDALQMSAIDRSAGIGRVAVRSILAGADLVIVLWHDRDRQEVISALEAAYASGELTDERLRASLRRILRVKLRVDVWRPAAEEPATADVAAEVASKAITLLRDRRKLIPLKTRPDDRIVYVGPVGAIADTVATKHALHPPARLTEPMIGTWSKRARALAGDATLIVGVAQNRNQMKILQAIRRVRPKARFLLISLGSPDLIRDLPDADAYVCAYGFLDVSQQAVARVLRGELVASGRLPVDLPGLFTFGAGAR
ncbi:MAG TPA: glycoside hydrolase family 3 protein [Thermoanaerobaculia bacterium]|nr:glycoside hydrolase family 3 protein [Thermoanaerobaculia bacterium]